MATLRVLVLLATLVAGIGPALAGPAEDLADVQRQWSEAFARWDLDKLVALYTPDALMYGTQPKLFVGRQGVRQYFEGLPTGVFKSAAFSDQQAVPVAPDVIASAGNVTFIRVVNGQTSELPLRITLVLVRRDGAWRIASHHAAPRG